MTFIQCKCTNCGANLQVDAEKDAAICPFCGTPYVLEKAVKYYNTTNQIVADVVNLYGLLSDDFIIRGGRLEKYNGASTEVKIPNTVVVIGQRAFFNCAITNVTVPDSVIKIESQAFAQCDFLRNISIPDSVSDVYADVFQRANDSLKIQASENWKKKNWAVHPSLKKYAPLSKPQCKYNVLLVSGQSSLKQIKAIREVTQLDLPNTLALFSALPYTLAKGIEQSAANDMKNRLISAGLSVEIQEEVTYQE